MGVGDSFYEWNVLCKIFFIHNSSFLSYNKICKEINLSRGSPSFNRVMNFLIEKDIIEVINEIGKTKILHINYKRLENYLRQRKPFLIIDNFIHKTTKFAVTG